MSVLPSEFWGSYICECYVRNNFIDNEESLRILRIQFFEHWLVFDIILRVVLELKPPFLIEILNVT